MGVYTFPKGICPKVNVIARLEYELAYYDSAVHRFNHYTTRTPRFYLLKDSRIYNVASVLDIYHGIKILDTVGDLQQPIDLIPYYPLDKLIALQFL